MKRNGNVTGPPRGGWAARHLVALVFVTALIAGAGACLQGGKPCGGSFCPSGHECVSPAMGQHLCVAPGHFHMCGNGLVEDRERCDDGNTTDGDRCSADCTSDERCGNGAIDAARHEVCDDGNERDGDGCSADCMSDERCGNGVVDAIRGEECDCGADELGVADPLCRGVQNADLRGYCRSDCKKHCGDGELAEDEICDTKLQVTTSCVSLRYDFGRPGCANSCDELSATPCGIWNWRRQEPVTSETLTDVWGSGPQDVFAVGQNGTISHYNGHDWQAMTPPLQETYLGVWGSGPQNVIAVGQSGTILHYHDQYWHPMDSTTSATLSDVWGNGLQDVFAVGAGGTILHYDGQDWQAMTSPTSEGLSGVWGSGPQDVFAVGSSGTILHYDGQ
ncbi:MAG TPA: DUF4215 domain-containing protein, partial [Sorangium sp.]|nr:DUF4215 domain-containing protein [Sorangium sp.]